MDMTGRISTHESILPGHDRQESVQVNVPHLLGVLHITYHLLQLALTGAVAQGPDDCPYLEQKHKKYSSFSTSPLSHQQSCYSHGQTPQKLPPLYSEPQKTAPGIVWRAQSVNNCSA